VSYQFVLYHFGKEALRLKPPFKIVARYYNSQEGNSVAIYSNLLTIIQYKIYILHTCRFWFKSVSKYFINVTVWELKKN